MRVLVLGGTGLISQEIVRQLTDRGDEVAIMNRGRTEAELPSSVTRLTGDRGELSDIRAWAQETRPDCVIDMIGYTAGEAEGLTRLAAGLIPRVLYCSTVDVFEKPQRRYPVRENDARAASPTFPYAVGKLESELLLEKAAADGAFGLTILRPAQTYGGPGHGPVHPLGHRDYHLWRLKQGRPVFLHGDGTGLWSACHARDVAAAFVAAAGEPADGHRSYNLASGELVTWRRYWDIVGVSFAGEPPAVVTVPSETLARRFGDDGTWLLENFRYNNVFDCSAAAADLVFASRTSLTDGMAELADSFGRQWLDQGAAEAGSAFDVRYEESLTWWRPMTQ
ncbi:MAG TPA: NAD-dependent epimerase/dehydratase family protein [Trebonia sp.]|nr:NAD-dependent epimerase/dehydratase family protein [Trebonia sp.]